MFDFPLHDAGDFDAITSLWIHVVLVVSPTRLYTYDDGLPVADGVYGYYTGGAGVQTAANAAYPHPGALTGTFGAFGMVGAIHLGARADRNADRHFLGDMAGLMISTEDLTDAQVQCIFTGSEQFLPAQLMECANQPTGQLSVSFLGNAIDMSGNTVGVTFGGVTDLTFSGVKFDAPNDYVEIADFDYETGGSFTVSFWMTKEDCTGGIYEYLYSHMTATDGDAMWTTSSINMYLGCELAGGGFSTGSGTVVRYSVVDTSPKEAQFDFPLHESGDFDAITSVWVHLVLGVTTTGMKTWDDGMPIPDTGCTLATVGSGSCPYHFYADAATQNSDPAYPQPSALNPTMGSFDFGSNPITLGARADYNADRVFAGKIAMVNVYNYAITDVQAECLFRAGDAALPDPTAIYSSSGCAPLVVDISFIGDSADRSGNGNAVTLNGQVSVDADGLHIGGQGDWAQIANFDYAEDGTFTIAYWMTKEACTEGIYEYLYSHAQDDTAFIDTVTNSNVNMYIGCETAGGGWSTAGTGTVLRYNLVDSAQVWASFDFPLHDAGDFDAITNLWIHVVLVVDGATITTYDDGTAVPDGIYGYYNDAINMGPTNAAYPSPTALTGTFGAFGMVGAIHLGARSDHNADRHFFGDMAGLMISLDPLTTDQVSCVFLASEEFLPAQLSQCQVPPVSQLSLPFLGSSADTSGNDVDTSGVLGRVGMCEAQDYVMEDWVVWTAAGHDILEMTGTLDSCRTACCAETANDGLIGGQAGQPGHDKECVAFSRDKSAADSDASASCWLKAYTPVADRTYNNDNYHAYTRRRVAWGGQAQVTASGAEFNTDADYVTILDFDYETGDGQFSVSFWMTKEQCTGDVYEYLYSHMSSTGADMWSTSSLNIYVACEEANGGFSTIAGAAGTSIIRYNIYDTAGKTAMFDYALHEAGDFDAITNVWVHTIFTVTPTQLATFDDGQRINDIGCNGATAGDGTAACPYGFYAVGVGPSVADSGVALPRPGALSSNGFGQFDFGMDLFLGTRADISPARNFHGKLALVNVYDFVLADTEAECLFYTGDAALPDPAAGGGGYGVDLGGPCDPNPCANGGICAELFGHFTCNCQATDYGGRSCTDAVAPPAPPPFVPAPPPPATQKVTSRVDVYTSTRGGTVPAGMTTMRMYATCNVAAGCRNIYTLAGNTATPLQIPAAYQVASPFGTSVGGSNPAFFSILPDAEFDSWLTLGSDDGSQAGRMSSIGIPWDGAFGWSDTRAIWTNNGALFFMDPDTGPSGDVLLAQLTVADSSISAATNIATMMLQGRSNNGADWSQNGVTFQL